MPNLKTKAKVIPPKHAATAKGVSRSDLTQTSQREGSSARLTPPSSPGTTEDKFIVPELEYFGPSVVDLYGATKNCLDETGVVDRFLEGSALLIGLLNEVKGIHPFVGVVVIAFKALLALEMTRRENNARIIAMHMAMRDMMAVLVKLKEVPAFEGASEMLHQLVDDTAKDIEKCANACDTYTRKNLLVKVLKGPVWEERFITFIRLFTERRSAFQFEINLVTLFGVGIVHEKVTHLGHSVSDIGNTVSDKLDSMKTMLQELMSPEEKELTMFIEHEGGIAACQEDNKLKALSNLELVKGSFTSNEPGRKTGGKSIDLEQLKKELSIDPTKAMDDNMKVFSRKFEVKKRLVEELSRAMERESDRIIKTVTSGPHDKIRNEDLRELWRVMRWRGSVKSRHFVMALRDYFHESWRSDEDLEEAVNFQEDLARESVAMPVAIRVYEPWALAYIHVTLVQPISEAFDDDGTGFVTVAEVNTFSTLRPIEWSLEHWIAYWAIGWHQSLWEYRSKIRELFAKMFAMLPTILPANRASANKYLEDVYQDVTTLESAVNNCYANKALQTKFKSHIQAEEARLEENLMHVRYDIDEVETVALVTGPGRIEKFILPLLYLILKRHFELFRICRIRNTHATELPDAASTIKYVVKAFNARFITLRSIFKDQRLNLKQQFDTFAHGLFKYHYEPSGLWAQALVRERVFADYTYNDHLERCINASDIERILNYPVGRGELDFAGYASTSEAGSAAPARSDSTRGAILGLWNGLTYRGAAAKEPNAGMVSMTLCAADEHDQAFFASGRCDFVEFSITGECAKAGEVITVAFTREVSGRVRYWSGQTDAVSEIGTADTITGTWGSKPDPATHRGIFILKRIAPDFLRFRPAPAAFHVNKVHALWEFARSAILDQVRRQFWPVSYFLQRQKIKTRFLELYKRRLYLNPKRRTGLNGSEDDSDEKEFQRIRKTLTPADSRLYRSQAEFEMERVHGYVAHCDKCNDKIYGARIICLDCEAKHTWSPVNLCEAEDCVNAKIDRDDLTGSHLPTHDVIKVRRTVHLRQWGGLEDRAKDALERANAAFSHVNPTEPGGYDSDDSSQEIYLPSGPASKPSGSQKEVAEGSKEWEEEAGPKCAACEKTVTQPCWYCVQCKDDTFICTSCDNKRLEKLKNGHMPSHDLVKCKQTGKEGTASLEDRLATLEERLGEIESKVDVRFSKVEKMLKAVLHELGGGASIDSDGEAAEG